MQASYLWKKLFTKKHLIEHYEEKVKNKPSVGLDKVSPRKFEQNLDENIEIIIRKSMNDSYHFTRYKQLLFTKGPAKLPRAICVPTLRDKLTASVLNELLVGVYGDKCKTSILKIEQSIEELFRTIKKENIEYLQWKLNLKITGFIIERHKYGWLFFYSQITDLSLLFHLDDVVQKLIKRYKLEGEIKVS